MAGPWISISTDKSAGSALANPSLPAVQAAPMIGATMDPSGGNGYDHCFTGYIQAVSVWNICISAPEITKNMQAEPGEDSGCVAYYSLAVDQPVNAFTGVPVSCNYNAAVKEYTVETNPSTFSLTRKPVSAPSPAHRTLWDLPSNDSFDSFVRPVPRLLSDEMIDGILATFEKYLVFHAPKEKHEHYREMFTRNLYHGIYLQESARGPLPGTVTFKEVGREFVFYHHTFEGPQECARLSAQIITPCQSWLISVIATAIGCLLSVFGVGYTLTKLTQVVLPKIVFNTASRAQILQRIINEGVSADLVIKIVRTLSGMTSITSVIGSALSGINWWSWAFTLTSLTVSIVSLWLTGGLFLIFMLSQLTLGIAQLVYVINQKPDGCNPAPEINGLSPISANAGGQGVTLSVSGNGFLKGTQINWNGSPRTTTYLNDTQVTAADLTQPGAIAITAVNPSSNNTPSNALTFYINTPS